jgi:hypothetical protein
MLYVTNDESIKICICDATGQILSVKTSTMCDDGVVRSDWVNIKGSQRVHDKYYTLDNIPEEHVGKSNPTMEAFPVKIN